jgi:hypothetical protein
LLINALLVVDVIHAAVLNAGGIIVLVALLTTERIGAAGIETTEVAATERIRATGIELTGEVLRIRLRGLRTYPHAVRLS